MDSCLIFRVMLVYATSESWNVKIPIDFHMFFVFATLIHCYLFIWYTVITLSIGIDESVNGVSDQGLHCLSFIQLFCRHIDRSNGVIQILG